MTQNGIATDRPTGGQFKKIWTVGRSLSPNGLTTCSVVGKAIVGAIFILGGDDGRSILIFINQPKRRALRSYPSQGLFLDLILNTHLEGAVLSPEHLLAMLDELGADHPDFQRAHAAFEAAEAASRTDHAAEVANRNILRQIIEQDELELALAASHTPLARPAAPLAAPSSQMPSTSLPVASRATPKPCPAIADITMIQTTLWDNWGSEKRPKTGGYKDRVPMNRFGCDIEVWTDAGATIVNIADLRKKLAFRSRPSPTSWRRTARSRAPMPTNCWPCMPPARPRSASACSPAKALQRDRRAAGATSLTPSRGSR